MFQINIFLVYTLLSLSCSLALAEPLGTVLHVDEGRPRLILDIRSDLWLRTTLDKQEPLRIHGLELKVPLYSQGAWVASINARLDGISFGRTDIRVGRDQVLVESSLRDQSAGFALRRQFDKDSSLSGFINYRSASDEPFKNPRDQWLELSFLYFSQKNDADLQWIVMSNQSHNRGFYNGQWFPFVGVHIDVNSEFEYSVGFPFLRFICKKDSGFNATLIATPTGVNSVITQAINEKFLALSHIGLAAYSFLHSNRLLPDDRAFFEEKYADIGFKYILSKDTDIGMTVGGSVDRFVYSGETAFRPDSFRNRLTNDFYSRLILEFHL